MAQQVQELAPDSEFDSWDPHSTGDNCTVTVQLTTVVLGPLLPHSPTTTAHSVSSLNISKINL